MDLTTFDKKTLDAYAAEAKTVWGDTDAYREYEARAKCRSDSDDQALARQMMGVFARFGALRHTDPAGRPAQELVKELQDFITAHYYTCTKEILAGLGAMYAFAGAFTENVDRAGGPGTAAFAAAAIQTYCK